MKKVRVFWTLHALKGQSDKYDKDKRETDFPELTNWNEAYESIWKQYGKRGRDDYYSDIRKMMVAPNSFADIQGWTVVETERTKAELETFKAQESMLFTPEMARESLMDSPRLAAKRRNQ
jgi:hypothetical protein